MSTENWKHFSLQDLRPAQTSLIIGADTLCKDRLLGDLLNLHANERLCAPIVIGATQARRAMYESAELDIVDGNIEKALQNLLFTVGQNIRKSKREGSSFRYLTTLVIDEDSPKHIFETKVFHILLSCSDKSGVSVILLQNFDQHINWYHNRYIPPIWVFFFSDVDPEHLEFMHSKYYRALNIADFCERFEYATNHGGCLVRRLYSLGILYYQPFGNTMHVLQAMRLFTY